MAGHFPFSGKANRVSVFSFFEAKRMSLALQEKYYTWWYDWAKDKVMKDSDLKAAKGMEFEHYPMGQHAHNNFHLHDYVWATALLDLGELIKNTLLPRLDADALHHLEEAHQKMLDGLLAQRDQAPRKAPPDVGRYRHT